MTETGRIAAVLEQTFEGEPYYGPSVLATLQDVGPELATRKWGTTKSIWELVFHMAAELRYARALIEGTAQPWTEGKTTWRTSTDTSAAAWKEAIEDLKSANRELVQAIRQLDDSFLERKAIHIDRPFYVVLHGTMQHSIYHSAQIVLLSRQPTPSRSSQGR